MSEDRAGTVVITGASTRAMVGYSGLPPRRAYDALVQRAMGLPREPPRPDRALGD